MTLGDHLRPLGMDAWLVGKTHMKVDAEGMARLGIERDSVIGARVGECGFDVFVRDDGLWGEGPSGFYDSRRSPYNEYLKTKGYDGDNPWADYANAGVTTDGEHGIRLVHAARRQAGQHSRGRQRNALADDAGNRAFLEARRGKATGRGSAISQLHQTALALYRANALS